MITRAEHFADMERRQRDYFGNSETWQERAERTWAAREKAAAWFDQPMPTGCMLVWYSGQEPEVFRTWDLYSLDDYDHVGALPPGMHEPSFVDTNSGWGCCDIERVPLPNGWTLVIGYHG